MPLTGAPRKRLRELPVNVNALPYIKPGTPGHPWMQETSKNRWSVNLTTWQTGHSRGVEIHRTFQRKQDAEKFLENKISMYKNPLIQSQCLRSHSTGPKFPRPKTPQGMQRRLAPLVTPVPCGTSVSVKGGSDHLFTLKRGLSPIPQPLQRSPRLARRAASCTIPGTPGPSFASSMRSSGASPFGRTSKLSWAANTTPIPSTYQRVVLPNFAVSSRCTTAWTTHCGATEHPSLPTTLLIH